MMRVSSSIKMVGACFRAPNEFSESLSSNHTIGFGMALFDHIVGNKISPKGDVEFVVRDEFANLPYPERKREPCVFILLLEKYTATCLEFAKYSHSGVWTEFTI